MERVEEVAAGEDVQQPLVAFATRCRCSSA
jgi:hypothetical protein